MSPFIHCKITSLICLGKSFSPLTGKNISCPDNKQNKIKQRASRDFLKLKGEKKRRTMFHVARFFFLKGKKNPASTVILPGCYWFQEHEEEGTCKLGNGVRRQTVFLITLKYFISSLSPIIKEHETMFLKKTLVLLLIMSGGTVAELILSCLSFKKS